MKHKFLSLWIIGLVGFVFTGISIAQNTGNDRAATSSLYVISAKAGAVNFISGNVSVGRKDSKSGSLLKGDNLEVGDEVSTGTDGKAEILLNPGSYLRLAENSKFEFVSTSLDDLEVTLTDGSSIFEVIADNQFRVTVNAGQSKFYLIKTGVYRLDAGSDGIGKISVWKGKAQIDSSNATVKSGQSISDTDGQAAVAKFDRKNTDELDIWSKSRAKEMAKINEKLIERDMNNSLINSFGLNSSSFDRGYGLWVFDASRGFSCFLPFSYGASSPYGFSYSQTIWNYPGPASYFYANNPYLNNQNGQYPNSGPPVQGPSVQTPPMGGNGGGNPFPSPSGGSSAPISRPIDTVPQRSEMPERQRDNPKQMENRRIN